MTNLIKKVRRALKPPKGAPKNAKPPSKPTPKAPLKNYKDRSKK